jgi:hypothetical protein
MPRPTHLSRLSIGAALLLALACSPLALGADAPKGQFSLDRIHVELIRDIDLDRDQKRTLRQAREDDSDKYRAFVRAHKAEFEAFEESEDAWKKANRDALNEAKKALNTARKIGEADKIAAAEAAYKKLLDTRPKLPAALERETFDPDKIIPLVRAVMKPEQMAEFEANVKVLKRMQEKAKGE